MKFFLRGLSIFWFCLLITCTATAPQKNESVDAGANADQKIATTNNADGAAEVSEDRKVYFFQHKLLARWVFESDGNFLKDLLFGNDLQMFQAATEIVSEDYAQNIQVVPFQKENAVLLIFPEPNFPANCYFAIIRATDQGHSYTTYEKTFKFSEDDAFVGVVGSWDAEGGHSNHGPRTYADSDSFVAEILAVAPSP